MIHPDLLPEEDARYREALRTLSPFTNAEFAAMVPGLKVRTLGKHEHFLKADEYTKTVGFLLGGSVRYYFLKDGVETTSYFSLEGDWVGAYTSFLRQEPSRIYIQALEDTRLLTFSFDRLRQWEQTELLGYRVNHFSRRLAEFYIGCYDDRVASFILQTPEERYLALLDQPEVMRRIPQRYIANYLGITPVSLSRIRKRIR